MPIEFACEACKKLLRVPDGSGGLSCECPACRTLLEIPDPAAIDFVDDASLEKEKNASTLKIPCPKCSNELICSPELLGTRGQCKKCKTIFTISTQHKTHAQAVDAEATGLIFTCPKCDQLFEGKEEMRGRKGRCHACGEVFSIELRTPETSALEAPTSQGNLTGTRPAASRPTARKPIASKPIASKPKTLKPRIPSPAPVPRPTQRQSRPPQATRAPQAMPPFDAPTSPPFDTSSAGPWIELGDMSGAAAPPYASHNYANFAPQPTSFAAPRPSGRRAPAVYVVPGIFMLLVGLATLLLLIYQSVQLAQQWGQLQARFKDPAITAFVVGAIVAIAVGFLQALLQILGGIAMIRRAGLQSARVGAIFSCLPCIFCVGLNLPIGIWATLVCYTGRPDKDFDF